jgi:hypothetical protein
MGILLGFAPFIVFALLISVSVSLGLWLAFAAAFVITIRDFVESPTLRLLDAGSALLFGLMALFTGFIDPSASLESVRLIVDGGFLAVALVSLVLRRPLTADYGHEHMPEALWNTSAFMRANYILTAVWTLAFAIMTAADAAVTYYADIPLSLDIAIGFAALGLAIAFTVRYPASLALRRERTDAGATSSSARKS